MLHRFNADKFAEELGAPLLELHARLQAGAAAVQTSVVGAARGLQAALLIPASLNGQAFVHELCTNAKLLVLVWKSCADLAWRVSRGFEGLRVAVALEQCQLYNEAALSAEAMQVRHATQLNHVGA